MKKKRKKTHSKLKKEIIFSASIINKFNVQITKITSIVISVIIKVQL